MAIRSKRHTFANGKIKQNYMNKLKLIVGLVCMLAVGSVAAQEHNHHGHNHSHSHGTQKDAHITGHVVDATSGEHLPYITITIEGTQLGSLTDGSGHFSLYNVPVGTQKVTASSVGYQSQSMTVEVVAHKTIEIKFELRPSMLEIDEVVVSGSRNESSRKESSSIVNVVSTKLFEKVSAVNTAEVLNYQPGLRVEYNCSNCGVPQLRINGLEGQYSQILLDSRPIFSSLAGVYGLEQLPAGMIERVEVIRGGGSALFGSSAIGGVVNIITKEPLRSSAMLSNQTAFNEDGGADVNTTFNASVVSNDFRSGAYIYGTVKNRDWYDRNDDGFSEVPQLKGATIGMRAYHRFGKYSKITADYHYINEFRRGGSHFDRQPHEADVTEQLKHDIHGGGLTYDFLSRNEKHHASVYASAQHIGRESYFGAGQDPNAFGRTRGLTATAGGQYTWSYLQDWYLPSQLTAGVEYTYDYLNDAMLGYNRIIDQTSSCIGGYVQNEMKNDKLGILLGVRVDKHNKIRKVIASPRANVRYAPIENLAFRVSYASGYRAPQAYDEDLHVTAVGGDVTLISLDPNLRPEYSHSVSGSADFYQRWGRFEMNLLVEGFYTELQDVFALREMGHDADGNILMQRVNASGATIAGLNVELKAGLQNKLVLDAGFTFQKSRYKEAFQWSEDASITPQRRMFRTPDTYGFAILTYNPLKAMTIAADLKYTGRMLVQHVEPDWEKESPAFWELGAKVAYNFRLTQHFGMELCVGVKNVLDQFQTDLDVGMNRDAGYIYGPVFPRTYYFGVKFTL